MKPVTLIGLDGATQKTLTPLLERGDLPNLSRISKKGFSGTLYSTVPSRTSPAIPSLYTGCDPSELGFSGFTKPNGDTITARDIDLPRIWTILDHHGMSSYVANVRTTYPPDKTEGVLIAGDPAPGEDSGYVNPPKFHNEIEGFRAEELDQRRHQELVPAVEHAEEVTDISIEILNRRFQTFIELLDDPAPFNMFWIGGTDFLQHRLWSRPDQLKRFYQEADRLIGRALDITDGDIFILSDHGFSEPSEWALHINSWLLQEGYLDIRGGRIGGQVIRVGQKLARKYIPAAYLRQILDYQNSPKQSDPDPPWFDRSLKNIPGVKGTSTAQLVSASGIDINATGSERKQIGEEIISGLTSLRTSSGDPAIKQAWLAEDLYNGGRYIEEVPDILIQSHDTIAIDPQITKSIFSKKSTDRVDHIHAREGVWMGMGPRIEKTNTSVSGQITDVTPTILYMLGLPVGNNMHGDVRTELLSVTDSLTTEDYRRGSDDSLLDEEEQEEMDEWLSDMGYI